MSKKILIFIVTFCILCTNVIAVGLTDIDGHWAKEYIDSAVNKGYFTGYPDNSFKPNNFITNAEYAKVLYEFAGFDGSTPLKFQDVYLKDWFYKPLSNLVFNGIYNNEGLFKPNDAILRGQAFSLLAKVYEIKGNINSLNRFKDFAKSDFDIFVAGLVENEIINGTDDNRLNLNAPITRAEVCKILMTSLDKLGDPKIYRANKLSVIGDNKINVEKIIDIDKKEVSNKPSRPHRPSINEPITPKPSEPVKPDDPITPEQKKYNVIFDSNGGSVVQSQIVEEGKKLAKPADPVYEGYRFIGWILEDDLYDFNLPINGDIKLTAKWELIEKYEFNIEEPKDEFAINEGLHISGNIAKISTNGKEIVKDSVINISMKSPLELVHIDSITSGKLEKFDYHFDFPDNLKAGSYTVKLKADIPENNIREFNIYVNNNRIEVADVPKLKDLSFQLGEDIIIPNYTMASFANGMKKVVRIIWQDLPDMSKPGTYEIKGKIEDYDQEIIQKIIVKEKPIEIISIIQPENVVIALNEAYELPKTIKTNLSNNTVEQRAVKWTGEVDNTKLGRYELIGKIEGYDEDIKLTVEVVDGPAVRLDIKFLDTNDMKKKLILDEYTIDRISTRDEYMPISGQKKDYILVVSGVNNDEIKSTEIKSLNPEIADITRRPNSERDGYDNTLVRFFIRKQSTGIAQMECKVALKNGMIKTKLVEIEINKTGSKDVVGVQKLDEIVIGLGEMPDLPKTVEAVMSDYSNKKIAISWEGNYDINNVGKYTLTGKVEGYNKDIELVLNIIELKNIEFNFNPESLTINEGISVTSGNEFNLDINGIDEAEIESITISSSNEKIIKVNQKNNFEYSLKTLIPGKAVINAELILKNKQKANAIMNVVVEEVPPEGDFNNSSVILTAREDWGMLIFKLDTDISKNYYFELVCGDKKEVRKQISPYDIYPSKVKMTDINNHPVIIKFYKYKDSTKPFYEKEIDFRTHAPSGEYGEANDYEIDLEDAFAVTYYLNGTIFTINNSKITNKTYYDIVIDGNSILENSNFFGYRYGSIGEEPSYSMMTIAELKDKTVTLVLFEDEDGTREVARFKKVLEAN